MSDPELASELKVSGADLLPLTGIEMQKMVRDVSSTLTEQDLSTMRKILGISG
jgi:hypothetical protein